MHILPLSAQEIENRLKNLPENAVVHEYNATSPYPVSGVAVAQALASLYTHYVGTEIDAGNISGATYITPNFKVNDIYINTEEKCMYQCTASEPLDDGTGAYRSTWRLVSPVIDQVFNPASENAVSGTAVNAAISEATGAANNYTDQKLAEFDESLPGVFLVTLTENEDGSLTASHSALEIIEHMQNDGRAVLKTRNDELLTITTTGDETVVANLFADESIFYSYVVCADHSVEYYEHNLASVDYADYLIQQNNEQIYERIDNTKIVIVTTEGQMEGRTSHRAGEIYDLVNSEGKMVFLKWEDRLYSLANTTNVRSIFADFYIYDDTIQFTRINVDDNGDYIFYVKSLPTNLQDQINNIVITNRNVDFSEGLDMEGGNLSSVGSITFGVNGIVSATGYAQPLENDPLDQIEASVLVLQDYNGDDVIIRHVADGVEDTDAVNVGQMNAAIAGIVNSAPETLDTLNELAAALGNDENFAATVAQQIGEIETKVGDTSVPDQISSALKENTLIVTIDTATGKASHTSSEIYEHIQNGGNAVFDHTGTLMPIYRANNSWCFFGGIWDDHTYEIYEIDEDGTIKLYDGALENNNTLIVTAALDTWEASHTSAQIYEHIANGGSVIMDAGGNGMLPVYSATPTHCYFGGLLRDATYTLFVVQVDGSIELCEGAAGGNNVLIVEGDLVTMTADHTSTQIEEHIAQGGIAYLSVSGCLLSITTVNPQGYASASYREDEITGFTCLIDVDGNIEYHQENFALVTDVENYKLITVEDIDAICGASIAYVNLSEGAF
jgi:hypothetical protein